MIASLARVVPGDIERAAEALKGAERWRIHVFISTSADLHGGHAPDVAPAGPGRGSRRVKARRRLHGGRGVPAPRTRRGPSSTSCWSASTSRVEVGATTINVPDTVGYATPAEFGEASCGSSASDPDHVIISTHCHNDLGLAVANSLAGVEHGARQVEGAVNGIGERAGNCSLEEIAMIVRTRGESLGVRHGLNLKEVTRTSRLVSSLTGYSVQPNKAVVGASAFAHGKRDPPARRAGQPRHLPGSWIRSRSVSRATGSCSASTRDGTVSPTLERWASRSTPTT